MIGMQRLEREDGETIAYLARAGKPPGLIWLGGFKSDMTGTKASALSEWAARQGRALTCFDYFGHGASSGDFREGTISRWKADALAVLDKLTTGPQVLIGSSMGGWISLLAALARPERVAGMLLLAPAADFTEDLMWSRLPDEAKRAIMEKGEWLWPAEHDEEPYPITRKLIEDGRKNLILNAPIALPFPVRILQGMQDRDVPWMHAVKTVERIESDVTLTLIKNGDHRLSTPPDLARMIAALEQLLANIT
jgi:pimeloyl-ACP methyl ester carboxylesterase